MVEHSAAGSTASRSPSSWRPPARRRSGCRPSSSALDDRFSLLSGGRRRAVDRHGTMRATIDWSYRLLDADEQRMFQWLAVFPNGFELDAARHVAGTMGIDERAATEHVASLVHKSMLAPEPHAQGVRYRMLETMRAFALEQLDLSGERLAALTALAEWVTTITDLAVRRSVQRRRSSATRSASSARPTTGARP